MIQWVESVAKNLKKYLIIYSIVALAVGWGLGIMYAPFAKDNILIFKNLVTVFVFFMIYPMMIHLDLNVHFTFKRDLVYKILGLIRVRDYIFKNE